MPFFFFFLMHAIISFTNPPTDQLQVSFGSHRGCSGTHSTLLLKFFPHFLQTSLSVCTHLLLNLGKLKYIYQFSLLVLCLSQGALSQQVDLYEVFRGNIFPLNMRKLDYYRFCQIFAYETNSQVKISNSNSFSSKSNFLNP